MNFAKFLRIPFLLNISDGGFWKSQKTPQSFYYSNNINLVFVASIFSYSGRIPLRGKCPKMEFFLVRMKENTDQKKLHILTLFTQCTLSTKENKNFYPVFLPRKTKNFYPVCILLFIDSYTKTSTTIFFYVKLFLSSLFYLHIVLY